MSQTSAPMRASIPHIRHSFSLNILGKVTKGSGLSKKISNRKIKGLYRIEYRRRQLHREKEKCHFSRSSEPSVVRASQPRYRHHVKRPDNFSQNCCRKPHSGHMYLHFSSLRSFVPILASFVRPFAVASARSSWSP